MTDGICDCGGEIERSPDGYWHDDSAYDCLSCGRSWIASVVPDGTVVLLPTEQAEYYSCTDVDYLRHGDVESAVEDYLDALDIEEWPETLVVRGYTEADVQGDADDGECLYDRSPGTDVTVNVRLWVKRHRPHWLEGA